jgi:putative addiction module killer protein
MWELLDYLTEDGRDPFAEWLADLADRNARARVLTRTQRMRAGAFGDCKPLREGVWELRIDHGPGYRVYYAQAGRRLVLLLVGGDKRRQQSDIETAVSYWHDWQRRNRS